MPEPGNTSAANTCGHKEKAAPGRLGRWTRSAGYGSLTLRWIGPNPLAPSAGHADAMYRYSDKPTLSKPGLVFFITMTRSLSLILVTCTLPAAVAAINEAEACVIVSPLLEDVHLAIRQLGIRHLSWYLHWPESLDIPDPETGLRPLMTALRWGKHRHFRELLRRGADPDLTDRSGNTTLIMAAQINEPALVLELLEAGADPHARNNQQQSFQRYLFMTEERKLSSRARKQRALVIAWMNRNGVPVDAAPE